MIHVILPAKLTLLLLAFGTSAAAGAVGLPHLLEAEGTECDPGPCRSLRPDADAGPAPALENLGLQGRLDPQVVDARIDAQGVGRDAVLKAKATVDAAMDAAWGAAGPTVTDARETAQQAVTDDEVRAPQMAMELRVRWAAEEEAVACVAYPTTCPDEVREQVL